MSWVEIRVSVGTKTTGALGDTLLACSQCRSRKCRDRLHEELSQLKVTALWGSCVQLWLKGRVHTRRSLAARALMPLPSFDVSRGATRAKPSVELLGSGEATRERGVFSEAFCSDLSPGWVGSLLKMQIPQALLRTAESQDHPAWGF